MTSRCVLAQVDRLILAVAAAQPNVVVVLCNGAPVEMPWVDDVRSVLEMYLGGQAAAEAVVDLLFGEFSPSGRIAETFPRSASDAAAYTFAEDHPRQAAEMADAHRDMIVWRRSRRRSRR